MIDTKVVVGLSRFAEYEFTKTEEYFHSYHRLIREMIASLKENPCSVERTDVYRNHTLVKSDSFSDLEGFQSFDVDKKGGWRFIWKVMYISQRDSNGNFCQRFSGIDDSNLPVSVKKSIWKDVITEESFCNERTFVYVFVFHVCFSDHVSNGEFFKCSIDYLLDRDGISMDKKSPFIQTPYSVDSIVDSTKSFLLNNTACLN